MPSKRNPAALHVTAQSRIGTVLADRDFRDEMASLAHTGGWSSMSELNASAPAVARQLDRKPNAEADTDFFATRGISEAIVLSHGRPVLFVSGGVVEKASSAKLEKLIAPHRNRLVVPIASVGRLELMDHDSMEWVGTGWRVDDDIVITNRHVANVFAQRQGNRFVFRTNKSGKFVRARIDFREEYRVPDSSEFLIAQVLWVAPDVDSAPDMAVLRVARDAGLPKPLVLAKKDVQPNENVAVVGYPARDSRNDSDLMSRIFGDVYDVKRFAPGQVVSLPKDAWHLTHDCTTLGGNSGSALLRVETGEVAGLHFGGQFRKTNFAVRASTILSLLKRRSWVAVTAAETKIPTEAFKEVKRTVAELKSRRGFADNFLGVSVPMPKPGKTHLVLKVGTDNRLNYEHFSVIMSQSRRFPIATAVNIDGAKKFKLKRLDRWGPDPRIARIAQVDHTAFYGPEAFDKGHMVRREDPGWGDTEQEARRGEDDTFVYTNAVPQMPQLNQKSWLSLEDYVLDNARTQGFKVSVFTGPVFRTADALYAGVAVPLDFYKVVAALDADNGSLLVSAYMLSQEGMMPEEGFRYGPFKTYQVPLAKVEKDADLRFTAAMRAADVFAGGVGEAAMQAERFLEIAGPNDLVLRRPL